MVTRFKGDGTGSVWMVKDDAGRWVSYKDYAELESAHKAAMLTISHITDIVRSSDTLSISQQVAELVGAAK